MEKKVLFHIIEWLVALAACAYLVYRLVVFDDYASLWTTLRSMDSLHICALLLSIALMPVNMTLEAWRWRTLWNGENGDASLNDANDGMMNWQEAHRQVYYSKLAGLITPWRLGEYPARAVIMSEGVNELTNERLWPRVLSMGAVGSATMTIAIIAAGMTAMVLSNLQSSIINLPAYYFLVGAALVLLILALSFAPRLLRRWAEVSHRLIIISTLQSLVRLACWCVQLALVLYALNAFQLSTFHTFRSCPWAENFQLLPIYYLLVTITPNVPIAEVGVRGTWAIVLFGSVNAALAGVLLWAINTLLPCLIWPFFKKTLNCKKYL